MNGYKSITAIIMQSKEDLPQTVIITHSFFSFESTIPPKNKWHPSSTWGVFLTDMSEGL